MDYTINLVFAGRRTVPKSARVQATIQSIDPRRNRVLEARGLVSILPNGARQNVEDK
jgi:hypothetical protein